MSLSPKSCTVALLLLLGCSSAGNHGPRLFPIQNKAVETGKTLEFDVRAADDDGDDLDFSLRWDPRPAQPGSVVFQEIDSSSARFSWSPIASDAGPDGKGLEYQVTFSASDGNAVDTETVTILVTLGGAGSGSPKFITASDHVLDLDRAEQLAFSIEVRDPDSLEVDLSLVEGIPGASFDTTAGSKTAAFAWQPTTEQAAERPVWGLRVKADDHESTAVFQDITILLKGGKLKCETLPPSIDHDPLPDQREASDYLVTAIVEDEETAVASVDLHWRSTLDDGTTLGSGTVVMSAAGGSQWQGSIPNPGLDAGRTAAVTYHLCGTDDDDPTGATCDLTTCVPEDGRFGFTAYAEGSTDCAEDDLEPNDVPGHAGLVELSQDGDLYLEWLNICPADEDWFRVWVPAEHRLGALLGFAQTNGALTMDLFDESGATLLAQGVAGQDEVLLASDVFATGETVNLRVRGADETVENRYDLVLVVEAVVPCDDDGLEPNNYADEARDLTEGSHTGLTCCGDPDFYAIDLDQGDVLDVLIEFGHAEGDLDLWIFDEQTATTAEELSCDNSVGCSTTETDDEQVVVPSMPADGRYIIAVAPYEGAQNGYDMTVTITPQTQECVDDQFDTGGQDNGAPDQATPFAGDVFYDDLELCPGDEDWFVIDLLTGEALLAEITFLHADGDLDLKMYREGVGPGHLNDHLVARGTTRSDDETADFTAEADGPYYIRVMGYGGAGNTYDLGAVVVK